MRADILDAAETIFANQGYAGTTLREISDRAGVTQGLISYYFKSKFDLFSETFLRRAEVISSQRIARLTALRADDGTPSVRAIVEAFLAPILDLRASAQGRAYLRLHARLHTEPPNLSYDLRKNAYDVSTNLYAEALHAALPQLSRTDISWRMTLMIGTYLYALSDTHRMDDLMAGSYDPEDADKLMAETVAFITSGLSRS